MARYWVYIEGKIQGPAEVTGLRRVPGFNLLSQVCMEGEQTWSLADDVLEIKSYFLSPPRASSLTMDIGNTALKIEAEATAPPRSASPLSVLTDNLVEELPPLESKAPKKNTPMPAPVEGKPGSLRTLCEVCGYKNPRDVNLCMKCGTPIAAAGSGTEVLPDVEDLAGEKNQKKEDVVLPSLPGLTAPPEHSVDAPLTPILEHKITAPGPSRWIWLALAVGGVMAVGLVAHRSWKKHQLAKKEHIPLIRLPPEMNTSAPKMRTTHSYTRPSRRTRDDSLRETPERLPGVSHPSSEIAASRTPTRATSEEDAPSSYRVIAEATPLKHRTSAPIDSPYTQKRRSDKTLWNAQQEQAIRQAQRARIYGGQRTVQRNVEILMQLLRDREYNTAFETGHRPYLYNDLDWSASIKDGPIYEVRLTLSGGREDDGAPRKALHFAFDADLERGTVEPGGEESVRNNTMHAFFDESRIPPEERRPIAKDVEEVVMAADPTASPLALDTVVRNFVATYNVAALERVAKAFDLDMVRKKLKHDTTIGKALGNDTGTAKKAEPVIFEQMNHLSTKPSHATLPSDQATPDEKKAAKAQSLPLAAIKGDFQMEHGSGHDRILQAQVTTKASPERVWEALTSYDRLKLFVPDVLESEREGQDGSAIIVHTVSLTRWMMFVFKINLHLRIIERPAQKVIEFERIAGDFETFRGSFEVQTNPRTQQSALVFHSTLAPKGKMPDWMLSAMAKRFIMPKLAAFTARAEAN